MIPAATAGTPLAGHVFVGGATASLIDVTDRISDRLLYCIAAVVLAAFLLLMVVFRSILVPLKAAIMNLLSIGAAYGVIVAVFQWGWGRALIGLDEAVPDRRVRAADDVRDPLRSVDGLRGLPALAHPGGVPPHRRLARVRRHRRGQDGPGDHRGRR